jgi:hypothetical protein
MCQARRIERLLWLPRPVRRAWRRCWLRCRAEGSALPVLGVDEDRDEPETGAARLEVGQVGGLGQVVGELVGGVRQPLRDALGVIEELAQVFGLVGIQDGSLGHVRDPF